MVQENYAIADPDLRNVGYGILVLENGRNMKRINSQNLSLITLCTISIFFLCSINLASTARSTLRQVTLEQALKAPPEALASGYLGVRQNLLQTRAVARNNTFVTAIDGEPFTIDASHKDDYISAFEERLGIYAKAINQRRFQKISGTYSTTVTPGCRSLGFIQGAKTIIEQNGFQFTLAHGQFQTISEGVFRGDFRFQGITVESTVVVEHPYSIDLCGGPQKLDRSLSSENSNCDRSISWAINANSTMPTSKPK
ncbi:hypothetical protein ACN4EG_04800 [Alkalinema pantanalense CENA528]|uniref:hypothetical protein n=1 Tax=Alkalinema pantanalense TaxID=1620705 RepID=UPI003D6E5E8B